MKKIIILVVIIILILIVSLSGSRNDNSEAVKIGVLTPLSGPIAIAGEVQKNSIDMAIEDLKSSGINLDQYEIIYEDSKYDPKTSLSGYEALKLRGVKIIIADGSPVVAAIREKAVKDGVLVFAQSATTPAFTDESPLTCRIGLTADIVAPSISDFVFNKIGVKNIAILTSNNEYGQVMKEYLEKSFKGTITAVEIYDQASGDLRTNISRLLLAKKSTDLLVVINNITPEPMFKQLKELGWDKPIVSDIWTITSPNMKDRALVSGVKFVDYEYSPQADLNKNAEAKTYALRYQDKFKNSPILLGALTYDSFNILFNTIKKVGSDPVKISEELTKLKDYQGITGIISMDGSCQNINRELVWRAVKTNGSFEDVK